MAFANLLAGAGHVPTRVDTKARVYLEPVDGRPTIRLIELETDADVPGIDAATFQDIAQQAKAGCPVSRALAAIEIRLTARLKGA
jgi:osmotically inducible protein OsmC